MIFLRSLKFNKPFKIYGYDYNTKDGTVERDYIHVVDLSISHVLALKNINNLNAFEIINLGNKKSYSVLEIVSHLNKFLLKNIQSCKIHKAQMRLLQLTLTNYLN